jgi:exosome complex RNA-binding protein Rrp42 (RNase PH superfamily)
MAQVSCSVQVPKSSRSNEGMLFINVEMSTMAAENFEAGRLGQLGIEVNRLVERCIKGMTIFTLISQKYSVISFFFFFYVMIERFLLC